MSQKLFAPEVYIPNIHIRDICILFQLSSLLNKLFIYIFDTLFLLYPFSQK